VPFTNIRRRTAEHMVRSKATSPHTLVVLEADYEPIERVRRAHGGRFKAEEGFSLTYLPFVARACVEALHEWPDLNSSVGDDALIVHHQVNLGIAVDLDHKGLIVPVVPAAEELTLRGLQIPSESQGVITACSCCRQRSPFHIGRRHRESLRVPEGALPIGRKQDGCQPRRD